MDFSNLDLGRLLNNERKKRFLSISEVARGVGVSPSYIYRLEKRERNTPSFEIYSRILNYFNLSYFDLKEYAQKKEDKDSILDIEIKILEFLRSKDIEKVKSNDFLVLVEEYKKRIKEAKEET